MQKVISDLLLDIASETNGYSIGKPWRFTEFSLAAVVPIARVTQDVRNYRLLSEVKDMVKIKDTGSIHKVELFNRDEYPALIKAGEIIAGATQARTLAVSQVLMPQEEIVADCVCVHSSMGIRGGQTMSPTTYSPPEVRKAVYRGYYRREAGGLETLGNTYRYDHGVQDKIWASVNQYSQALSHHTGSLHALASSGGGGGLAASADFLRDLSSPYASPSNDLAGRVTESQDKLKEILKQVPKVENQVGICLLTMTGFESLESFNHPEAWEAIRKAILSSEADKLSDVSDQDGLFEFREGKARSIIQELLRKQYEERKIVSKERTATYILDEERFMGEVVVLDGRPIHCAFMRKAS